MLQQPAQPAAAPANSVAVNVGNQAPASGSLQLPSRRLSVTLATANNYLAAAAKNAGNNIAQSSFATSVTSVLAKSVENIKGVLHNGGLAPLQSPFSLDETASLAARTQPRPSDGAGAAVAMSVPLLAVRIAALDGPVVRNPNLVHPVVRVHVVDATTGRYLRVLDPVQSPPDAQGGQGRRKNPVGATAAVASNGCTCFSPSPETIPSSTPHAAALTTAPAINRSMVHDAGRLCDAGVTAVPSLAGSCELVGGQDGSLLFADTLVFPVPLSEVAQPNVLLMFELLEHGSHLPKFLGKGADGHHRVAWGYMRPLRADGSSNVDLDSRVPLGIPADIAPNPTLQPPGTVTSLSHLKLVDVQLHEYLQTSWSDRFIHHGSLPVRQPVPQPLATGAVPALDVADVPSPDVALQFRLLDRRHTRMSLRVSAFGAVVPGVRYVRNHDYGCTHTYISNQGRPIQVQVPMQSLMEHPMLGRPKQLVDLPTDVYQYEDNGITAPESPSNAAAQQAAQAAAAAAVAAQAEANGDADLDERDPVTGRRLPPPRRIAPRSQHEPNRQPASIIGTVPTAKQGTTSVSVSPDGMLVAVACIGDQLYPIRVFEVGRGREVACLEGHGNIIYQISWSPNGQFLLSASGDGTAIVWHIPRAGPNTWRLRGPAKAFSRLSHVPPAYVYCARFHALDPTIVVTGSYDHSLRLWDTRVNEASVFSHGSMQEASFLGFIGVQQDVADNSNNPNSDAMVATSHSRRFASGFGATGTLGGGAAQLQHPHSGHVNCVEFDDVAETSGSARRMITADSNGVIIVWDCTKGRPSSPSSFSVLRELRPSALKGVPIVSLKVRPGHAQMLVLGQQNILRLFDLNTYSALRAYPNARCSASRLEASFSPDGHIIAAGSEDGLLCLWDADSGAVVPARATTDDGQKISIGYPSLLLALSWSPVSHMLAIGAFGLEYPVMLCT